MRTPSSCLPGKLSMRVTIAIALLILAVGFGIVDLLRAQWFSGLGFLAAGFLTAGLLIFGLEFTSSPVGLVLAPVTCLLGVCAFFFENRAFDLNLDRARLEAALALVETNRSRCGITDSDTRYQSAIQACVVQSNADRMAAVNQGLRAAYVPTELDLAEKLFSRVEGVQRDACAARFLELHKECPDAFLSVSKDTIRILESSLQP